MKSRIVSTFPTVPKGLLNVRDLRAFEALSLVTRKLLLQLKYLFRMEMRSYKKFFGDIFVTTPLGKIQIVSVKCLCNSGPFISLNKQAESAKYKF